MPTISKLRLTNILYEEGAKRYQDELFHFDGHNAAILLENGGGKTVLIHAALQAVLPHQDLAERKIKSTLLLEEAPAHIAMEWILSEHPRRYLVTGISLFIQHQSLDSLRYVYEYGEEDEGALEKIPFLRQGQNGQRFASKGEMADYYGSMKERSFHAKTFQTIKEYRQYLESHYQIIATEWEAILKINSTEGGVETFFDDCKTTNQLLDRLLIRSVEDAMEGHHKNTFPDLFEKHYESLKNYKKLKETLQETEKLEGILQGYTKVHETLQEKVQAYEEAKGKTKGLYDTFLTEKARKEADLTEEKAALNALALEEHLLQKNTAALHIHETKNQESLLFDYAMAKSMAKDELKETIFAQKNRYYSHQKEKKIKDLEHLQGRILLTQKDLKALETTEEEKALEASLAEVLGKIRHQYETQLAFYQKEIQSLQFHLLPIKEEQVTLAKNTQEHRRKQEALQIHLGKVQSQEEQLQASLEKIRQDLLAHEAQGTMKEMLKVFEKRSSALEEEVVILAQSYLTHGKDYDRLVEEKIALQETMQKAERHHDQMENQLALLNKEQAHLLADLSLLRPEWGTISSLYEKEEALKGHFQAQMEVLKRQKEELLVKERQVLREQEDYGTQKTFFADPVLARWVPKWSQQFVYLKTGVSYYENLSQEERDALPEHLWPMMLITTEKERGALTEKVQAIAKDLSYPIFIFSDQDLKDTSMDQVPKVLPSSFHRGLQDDVFKAWQQDISRDLQRISADCRNKEEEFKLWEHNHQLLRNHLTRYPHEMFKELTDLLAQEKKTLTMHQGRLGQIHTEEASLAQKMKVLQREKEIKEDARKELERVLREAHRYLQEADKLSQVQEDLHATEKQLVQVASALDSLEEKASHLRTQHQEKQLAIQLATQKEHTLRHSAPYELSLSYAPVASTESLSLLEVERDALSDRLKKIHLSKDALLERLAQLQEQERRASQTFQVWEKEHGAYLSSLTKEELWTIQEEALLEEIQRLEATLPSVEKAHEEARAKLYTCQGKLEKLLQDYKDTYEETTPLPLSTSIKEARDSLAKEQHKQEKRRQYLQQNIHRLEEVLKSLQAALHRLDRYEEAHHFLAPDVVRLSLSASEEERLSYKRENLAKDTIQYLLEKSTHVTEYQLLVGKEKKKVQSYISKQLSDEKLKETVLGGIDTHDNYPALVTFKENMLLKIHAIRSYASENIRKSDQDLSFFIDQIYIHLQTITEELQQIPKKTKIKFQGEWKQIYKLTLPLWAEDTGKMRIRLHIEELLADLEKNAQGGESSLLSSTPIRKALETRLDTRQLLRSLLNNENIKIRCHKVQNDNQISTRSYTWEESNKWSGGEKWSKNMTLFLGLLNYVAEKKQPLLAKMKRHRVVILDNPFGKASSDHVLGPVFFVAEQLGFQIITLTAHSEGKFLKDYFPVIYSCRLRATQGIRQQIITKERTIQTAYFKDHAPESLLRMGLSTKEHLPEDLH